MPRTKSLAALIEQYGDDRGYKPNSNKIPLVYKILNRQIFKNQLKIFEKPLKILKKPLKKLQHQNLMLHFFN